MAKPLPYRQAEKNHKEKQYNRVCIDGSITSTSCCVGYCNFEGHRGYLTSALRKEHDCLNKKCDYYSQKPKKEAETPSPFAVLLETLEETKARIYSNAQSLTSVYEGMRIMGVVEKAYLVFEVTYITISNDYPFDKLSEILTEQSGCKVTLRDLQYPYEKAAEILLDT